MTLKKDEKSEEELTCRFKINIRNFDSSTQKSKKNYALRVTFDQNT